MADTATAAEKKFQQTQRHRLDCNTEPLCIKIIGKPPMKKTIVPVIFIPGIFGSRLENPEGTDKESCYIWDPNRTFRLIGNYAKGISSIFMERHWEDDEIDKKVTRMHGSAVVMKDHRHDGKENDNNSIIRDILRSPTFSRLTRQYDRKANKNSVWEDSDEGGSYYTELAYQVANEEYERRSKRGWYGVLDVYDPLLETLHELKDPEFIYPVYTFGYDWRYDLDKAAEKLRDKINEVMAVQEYPDIGEQGIDYEKIHSKAIIVTHSQGSMVARYALTKLGANAEAVVHLDQPTTGAPVLYHRFITGSGPERAPFDFCSLSGILGNVADRVFGAILGNSAYHFTRMAAPLTGALCLLPTNDYIAKQGDEPFKWLIPDGVLLKFDKPVKDVYEDIYLSEKYGLINCKRYDATGNPKPYQEREFEIVQSTFEAGGETKTWQQPRHTLALGELEKLSNVTILPPPADNPYQRDNQRLRPNVDMRDAAYMKAEKYWKKFKSNIESAQFFHTDLGLDQHSKTHVVSSRGVATVTTVKFELDMGGLLKCPLNTKGQVEGDGTVPLTSQEALVHQGDKKAMLAGKTIVGGKHAEICTHPEAMAKVSDLLRGEFVAGLRTQSEEKRA